MSFTMYLNELVTKNHQQFKNHNGLHWMNPYKAPSFDEQRNQITNHFSDRVEWSFNHSKPWINKISRGCQLCGEGQWSCLFLTGLCNANCFYCPTSQIRDHAPATQQFEFSDPNSYASYVNQFGFKGVSFSGGEPLLFFDRLLDYLRAIRKQCDPNIYLWMYTNGKLLTREKAVLLAEAGLNEIRFDIGATHYKFDHIYVAKGTIPEITVEIPAVPEEMGTLKQILPQLIDAGVSNLNLHQMRLTEYNASKLERHNYTYIHGEAPSVLESELMALEIIQYADQNKLSIGINYCGFQYKNRFQKAGFRTKLAEQFGVPKSFITPQGYLCSLKATKIDQDKVSIYITPEIFLKDLEYFKDVEVSFHQIVVREKVGQDPREQYISIGDKDYQIKQVQKTETIHINDDGLVCLSKLLRNENVDPPEEEDLFLLWRHLNIEYGFRDYF